MAATPNNQGNVLPAEKNSLTEEGKQLQWLPLALPFSFCSSYPMTKRHPFRHLSHISTGISFSLRRNSRHFYFFHSLSKPPVPKPPPSLLSCLPNSNPSPPSSNTTLPPIGSLKEAISKQNANDIWNILLAYQKKGALFLLTLGEMETCLVILNRQCQDLNPTKIKRFSWIYHQMLKTFPSHPTSTSNGINWSAFGLYKHYFDHLLLSRNISSAIDLLNSMIDSYFEHYPELYISFHHELPPTLAKTSSVLPPVDWYFPYVHALFRNKFRHHLHRCNINLYHIALSTYDYLLFKKTLKTYSNPDFPSLSIENQTSPENSIFLSSRLCLTRLTHYFGRNPQSLVKLKLIWSDRRLLSQKNAIVYPSTKYAQCAVFLALSTESNNRGAREFFSSWLLQESSDRLLKNLSVEYSPSALFWISRIQLEFCHPCRNARHFLSTEQLRWWREWQSQCGDAYPPRPMRFPRRNMAFRAVPSLGPPGVLGWLWYMRLVLQNSHILAGMSRYEAIYLAKVMSTHGGIYGARIVYRDLKKILKKDIPSQVCKLILVICKKNDDISLAKEVWSDVVELAGEPQFKKKVRQIGDLALAISQNEKTSNFNKEVVNFLNNLEKGTQYTS